MAQAPFVPKAQFRCSSSYSPSEKLAGLHERQAEARIMKGLSDPWSETAGNAHGNAIGLSNYKN